MRAKKMLASLVAIFALVFVVLSVSSVSAFADIDSVQVNGIENFGGQTAGVFAGEIMTVRVVFTADTLEEDVRVIARILGEPGLSEATERFDVLAGNTYSRLLRIQLPYDIDPSEDYVLEVSVESNSELADERAIELEVQRASYEVEIIAIEAPNEARAGENVALDVVLKNRGRHEAEDTFVRATILELGISTTVYFGDLAPEDNFNGFDDEEDAVERRLFLNVPRNVLEGLYTLELKAFNADSSVVRTQKIFISSSAGESGIFSGGGSKTFSVGEEETYTMTIVNSGNRIMVYDLIVQADNALDVKLDEEVVAVPAGSSKVVRFTVSASEEGTHRFSVNVHSQDGALLQSKEFTAKVNGDNFAGNAAVLLTVVLAIVFVVLLVVLIVLLTRRPEKSENSGESYY